LKVLALFGPTAVGKTGVAIAVAERLRARGEDPVAVNCDSIQVYRGLEKLSGAATAAERSRLEHRLLSFIEPGEEFSAGRYAEAAHREIDALLAQGRRPIVVGGTGLYLRAALADLDLRPPVPVEVRDEVESEIARRGPEALHAELEPELGESIDPSDRKRIARLTELSRAGIEPAAGAEGMWTAELRHPALLIGLTMDRKLLAERISRRVDGMVAAGAAEEARAALEVGPSRTARAALGFEQLVSEIDAAPSAEAIESIKSAHRAYARRQLTWMRRMEDVTLLDCTERDAESTADDVLRLLDCRNTGPMEREASGDGQAAEAVVRRLVDWFAATPFELVRETFLAAPDFESASRRIKEAGYAIPDVIDPDVEIPPEGVAGVRDDAGFRGRDGFIKFWAAWFEPWEAYEWAPENWQQVGDAVVIDTVNRARGRGSGAPVEWTNAQIWTARDGRITRVVGYETREQAMASLGRG
jgi:tRNA dimethylallyltransferase